MAKVHFIRNEFDTVYAAVDLSTIETMSIKVSKEGWKSFYEIHINNRYLKGFDSQSHTTREFEKLCAAFAEYVDSRDA